MDTAASMQIKTGLDLIEKHVNLVRNVLVEMTIKYRDTPMAGMRLP